jgi:hypothetical protein
MNRYGMLGLSIRAVSGSTMGLLVALAVTTAATAEGRSERRYGNPKYRGYVVAPIVGRDWSARRAANTFCEKMGFRSWSAAVQVKEGRGRCPTIDVATGRLVRKDPMFPEKQTCPALTLVVCRGQLASAGGSQAARPPARPQTANAAGAGVAAGVLAALLASILAALGRVPIPAPKPAPKPAPVQVATEDREGRIEDKFEGDKFEEPPEVEALRQRVNKLKKQLATMSDRENNIIENAQYSNFSEFMDTLLAAAGLFVDLGGLMVSGTHLPHRPKEDAGEIVDLFSFFQGVYPGGKDVWDGAMTWREHLGEKTQPLSLDEIHWSRHRLIRSSAHLRGLIADHIAQLEKQSGKIYEEMPEAPETPPEQLSDDELKARIEAKDAQETEVRNQIIEKIDQIKELNDEVKELELKIEEHREDQEGAALREGEHAKDMEATAKASSLVGLIATAAALAGGPAGLGIVSAVASGSSLAATITRWLDKASEAEIRRVASKSLSILEFERGRNLGAIRRLEADTSWIRMDPGEQKLVEAEAIKAGKDVKQAVRDHERERMGRLWRQEATLRKEAKHLRELARERGLHDWLLRRGRPGR